MLCIGAVPLAFTQPTLPQLNRAGAFSERFYFFSELFHSLRSLLQKNGYFLNLCARLNLRHILWMPKLLPLHKIHCVRNVNSHSFD